MEAGNGVVEGVKEADLLAEVGVMEQKEGDPMAEEAG